METRKHELLKNVIKNIREDMTDEEIIHTMLKAKMSADPEKNGDSFGAKAADSLAKFAGSWTFVIGFALVLVLWILLNVAFLTKREAFDPYPFILLNLVLSCVAAIQAPLIMMSQNRQEQKDRERNENDYKVNLKTEVVLEDTHYKLDKIIHRLSAIEKKLTEAEISDKDKTV